MGDVHHIKILIADNHEVVIEGIKAVFQGHPEFEVVGEALDGVQALEQVRSLRPDIVIMDISMPHMNGIEAARRIKRLAPDVRVIIFTIHSNRKYIIELLKIGISAYVLKESPLSELILAVKAAKEGGTYLNPVVAAQLIHEQELEEAGNDKDGFEQLSMREREVLKLLADGKTVKEIASQLCISPKTVESHKYHIMTKLGVRTIAGLTKIAIKRELIQL
ncbi:MAG: response regulator transcription factor [Deltaproteobacteria bacterium]|nr:response regulator transcription factor [Deltaproteobacteria bacterium]MBW1946960.1 response regulator transcription factor [Deltaproteobacteria bacterium]MBW1965858.1 response regulator transcription factor [Deltaproteobacteria bacterium]MBW2098548.1 response regulator transcription factor [Deltaproteobacteria bacterium]